MTPKQIEEWRKSFLETYPEDIAQYHKELNELCDLALLGLGKAKPLRLLQ